MTQLSAIKGHLKEGRTITPLQALTDYGCFRLASVVNRLRAEGMDIITNIKTSYKDDDVKHFAEYHLRTIKQWGEL